MLNSADYIYGIFLSGSYYGKDLLKALYKRNPELFMQYLNFLFHEEFKQSICVTLNIPYTAPHYSKVEMYQMFNRLAEFYVSGLSDTGKYFLNKRGINIDSIKLYKIGSTENVFDLFENVIEGVNKDLALLIVDVHEALMRIVEKLYGNPHFVTIPSFNTHGDCVGICLRAIKHKRIGDDKNLFKFHFLNAPDYLFGEHVIDKYSTVYVVEGVFDVIALNRIGIQNVVCLGNTTMSPWQYNKLRDKKLIFIMDNDLGGQNGIMRFRNTYPMHDARFYLLPDERDLDEMHKNERLAFVGNLRNYQQAA